jgi:hypothetical protein
MAIPKFEADLNIISKLADKPNDAEGLSAQAFKEEFDRAGLLVKEYINEILVPQANIDIDNASKGIGGSEGMDGSTIADGTVTASKLSANSVTAEKIAEDAVTAEKIAPKAVNEEAFADASIPARAYKQGSVTAAALAQNSVTADKIAEGAVSGAKLANGSVGTAKIADAAVTRAKLATDVLYSPIMGSASGDYALTIADLGKTIRGSHNAGFNVVVTADASTAIPYSAEFAIFRYCSETGGDVTVTFDGVNVCGAGWPSYKTSPTIKIVDSYAMIAIKKVTTANMWLVTGNVEVVE